VEARRKRAGVRLFFFYFFAWVTTFVTINVVQAHQNGGGIGLGDTKVIPHGQVTPYFPPPGAARAGGGQR